MAKDGRHRVTRLPAPSPGLGVWEPHIAIDPVNPRRAAVTAMYGGKVGKIARSIWCWHTIDGGETWSGDRIMHARFDDEGAADPLIGYGEDGAIVAVSMAEAKAKVELSMTEAFTRQTAPTLEDVVDSWQDRTTAQHFPSVYVCLHRSEDNGHTWSSVIIPNSEDGDKTALGIDRGAASPYRGHLYVAWAYPDGRLGFARSVDRGRSVEPGARIGSEVGRNWDAQIAVAPDGTVHLLWTVDDFSAGSSSILHAQSHDGGVTFTTPDLVVERGGSGRSWLISLAAAPDGAMLVVWSEADHPASERGAQPLLTIRWMYSRDGKDWSRPTALPKSRPDIIQGLPAVATTDHAWHVLSYDAGPEETEVKIYSANHDDLQFQPTTIIASRRIGSHDIFLGANSCCADPMTSPNSETTSAWQVLAPSLLQQSCCPKAMIGEGRPQRMQQCWLRNLRPRVLANRTRRDRRAVRRDRYRSWWLGECRLLPLGSARQTGAWSRPLWDSQ